jgi:nucleoid DNA-binding protein
MQAKLRAKRRGRDVPSTFSLAYDFPVRTMTKNDISKAISEELDVAHYRTKPMVNKVLDQIAVALMSGQRVELRNFGVFEMRYRRPRARNMPGTDLQYQKPSKFYVHFRPSTTILKEKPGRLRRGQDERTV